MGRDTNAGRAGRGGNSGRGGCGRGGGELTTNVCALAQDVHITPGITETLLMSTAKFAKAGYTTIIDGDQVNIYDQHDTIITVSRTAIIRGWREPGTMSYFRSHSFPSYATTIPK